MRQPEGHKNRKETGNQAWFDVCSLQNLLSSSFHTVILGKWLRSAEKCHSLSGSVSQCRPHPVTVSIILHLSLSLQQLIRVCREDSFSGAPETPLGCYSKLTKAEKWPHVTAWWCVPSAVRQQHSWCDCDLQLDLISLCHLHKAHYQAVKSRFWVCSDRMGSSSCSPSNRLLKFPKCLFHYFIFVTMQRSAAVCVQPVSLQYDTQLCKEATGFIILMTMAL